MGTSEREAWEQQEKRLRAIASASPDSTESAALREALRRAAQYDWGNVHRAAMERLWALCFDDPAPGGVVRLEDGIADVIREMRAEASPAARAGGGSEPWTGEADALAREVLAFVTADQRGDDAACRGKSVSGIIYAGAERIFALGRATPEPQGSPDAPTESELRRLLERWCEERGGADEPIRLRDLIYGIVERLEGERR